MWRCRVRMFKDKKRQINIIDFMRLNLPMVKTHRLLINIRGTNGAGKSTIPQLLIDTDSDTFELVWKYNTMFHTIATVCPNHGIIILGKYQSVTGGMDYLVHTQEIKEVLEVLWNTGYHILMEGAIVSTVRSTYITMFKTLNIVYNPREIVIFNIIPPLEVCTQRVLNRNGGHEVNENVIRKKWNLVRGNAPIFKEVGFTSIECDNSHITKERTLEWFFKILGDCGIKEYQGMTEVKTYSKPYVSLERPYLKPTVMV